MFRSIYHRCLHTQIHLYTDASLCGGAGFILPPNAPLYSLRPEDTFFMAFPYNPSQGHHLREFEAVRRGLSLVHGKGSVVVVAHCDNRQVVDAMAGVGRLRDIQLNSAIKEMFRDAQKMGLQVTPKWLSRKDTRIKLADALSRRKDVSRIAPLLKDVGSVSK